MIPTPVEARDMAEQLLEKEPAADKPVEDGWDCGKVTCYKYRNCWACDEWLSCKGKKAEADCFVCDQAACPGRTGDARPYEEVGE